MGDGRVTTAKVARRSALACLGLLALYFAVPVDSTGSTRQVVVRTLLSGVALAGLVVAVKSQLLRQIDQPDAPLGGLLTAVVAGVLFFSLLDFTIAVHQPDQFAELHTRVDALYFSLSTLATVGFGDVHAQGQLARGVLCVQLVFNVAVLATAGSMLARQIGKRARDRSR